MLITRAHIKIFFAVVFLTALLTWFFYVHEKLPKPIRAATALIEMPVAIASGISHYLNLGIQVYETPWAIIFTNLIFSFVFVLMIHGYLKRRMKK